MRCRLDPAHNGGAARVLGDRAGEVADQAFILGLRKYESCLLAECSLHEPFDALSHHLGEAALIGRRDGERETDAVENVDT